MRTLSTSTQRKLDVLRGNSYFDQLEDAALPPIAEHMLLREFGRGEMLFLEGEACAGLHIIEQGRVKLYRVSPHGREYILRLLQAGATCNEVPTFDGGLNAVNVQALETSQVWVIAPQVLRQLLKQDNRFAQRVIDNLAGNLRTLVVEASEMALLQVTFRLARLIGELPAAELNGESGSPLTQEILASRLGTVREVVARALKELERSGAIRAERRKITILDRAILDRWITPLSGEENSPPK